MLPEEMIADARAAYSSPGRAYHTFDHVREVMDHFAEVERELGWARPREVEVAVLYHDAIYVPGRKDNEEKSAELARAAVGQHTPEIDGERVTELILLTARHGQLSPADVDGEAALFLDCDMAILGSGEARFAEYQRQIAIEYSHLPPELYAAGRRQFLSTVLAMPRIFLSKYFHARLDARARDNLRRSLALS